MILQVVSSHGFDLEMGDVEQAFTNGWPLARRRGPLYADMPKDGIPGVSPGAVIELKKTVYGLVDGPREWWSCFMAEAKKAGFRQTKLEPSVLTLIDKDLSDDKGPPMLIAISAGR